MFDVRGLRFDVNFGFRNQAATDAKQRPGFQPRKAGNKAAGAATGSVMSDR